MPSLPKRKEDVLLICWINKGGKSMKINVEDVKNAIHKLDIMKKSYIVFMNSDDADSVKASIPKIERERSLFNQ